MKIYNILALCLEKISTFKDVIDCYNFALNVNPNDYKIYDYKGFNSIYYFRNIFIQIETI